MNTPLESFDDSVEVRLDGLRPSVAADGLRAATLVQVRRELRASRWDRRLGRVAAGLLAVGIGMNVAIVERHPTSKPSAASIAELAVTMAEVTDTETAEIIVRHMAALGGLPLSEINRHLPKPPTDGKAG